MKRSVLIGLLFLCACDQKRDLLNPLATTLKPMPHISGSIQAVDYYIGAGQSNMEGFGDYIQINNPNVHMGYARSGGPIVQFGLMMQEQTGHTVILLNCAIWGSFMDAWLPSSHHLYQEMLQELKDAQAKYGKGEVKGFLFLQGEAEGANLGYDSYPWADNFGIIVNSLRQDLNNPHLPVVFSQIDKWDAQISGHPGYNWQYIKDQQSSVNLPNCLMIKSDDLPLRTNDAVHITGFGMDILGERFYNTMLQLIE